MFHLNCLFINRNDTLWHFTSVAHMGCVFTADISCWTQFFFRICQSCYM